MSYPVKISFKKQFTFTLLLCCSISAAFAQQLPQFTQVYFNKFMLNPAVAGSEEHYDIRTNNRYQWTGITDAPRTFSLSAHGPTKNKKMGLGAFLFADNVGPSRRTGFQGVYAYHLMLSEATKLSFGLSFGVQEFAVDVSKITLKNPNDNAFLVGGIQRDVNFDAGFGAYLYRHNYYIGFTAPQLFGNKLTFFNDKEETLSQLENHFILMGGYLLDLNSSVTFEPIILVKYIDPVPPIFNAGTRVIYKNDYWIGATYRSSKDISAMIGFNYQDNLSFGYAYDFTTSNLATYSNGTHEIMLGLRFIRAKMNGVRKTEEKSF